MSATYRQPDDLCELRSPIARLLNLSSAVCRNFIGWRALFLNALPTRLSDKRPFRDRTIRIPGKDSLVPPVEQRLCYRWFRSCPTGKDRRGVTASYTDAGIINT